MSDSITLEFGPFAGQTLAQVAADGRSDYLRWLRDIRRQERGEDLTDLDRELDALVVV